MEIRPCSQRGSLISNLLRVRYIWGYHNFEENGSEWTDVVAVADDVNVVVVGVVAALVDYNDMRIKF